MTSLDLLGLLIIAIAAVAAPLLAELVPNGLMPPVVLEVLAGVVLGPQVLGWLHVDSSVELLSLLGLGFLLFLAGMELTPSSLWNRQARIGMAAFVIAVALAFPLALVLRAAGADGDIRILALALTSTSLGVVVPILRDAGEASSHFGQTVLVTASIGEFASLLLLTVLFSADPKSTPVQILYVIGLAVSGLLVILLSAGGGEHTGSPEPSIDSTRPRRSYGCEPRSSSFWRSPHSSPGSASIPSSGHLSPASSCA